MHSPDPQHEIESPQPQYSLLVEIGRGWEWAVFSVKMLSRVGGPLEIIKTIFNSINILVIRTMRQWGLIRGK
jgi:hypothetical protein